MNDLVRISCKHNSKKNFDVTSGKLILSDPCYEKGIWCAKEIDNVLPGKWNAYVKPSVDGRNAELIACHENFVPDDDDSTSEYYRLAVDSGQMSIVDSPHYEDDDQFPGEWGEPNIGFDASRFYGFCCEATLSRSSVGLIPYGCVASSGYGDGSYNAYVYRTRSGYVYMVRIVFIGDDDEDDEYELEFTY